MPFTFSYFRFAEKKVELDRKRKAADYDPAADADQDRPTKKPKTSSFVPKDLDQPPRYHTRYASKARSRVFPFFKLPRELRDLIYDFALEDPIGINTVIDSYYKRIANTTNIHNEKGPRFRRGTPNVLTINKQFYSEAFELLAKKSVSFTHGMLDLTRLADFASPDLFANLGSIEINDSGHELFQENIKEQSMFGYITLISELADVLKDGHNLKSFKLILNCNDLASHMSRGPHGCWDKTHKCGPRDSIRRALVRLRQVTHIKSVTFGGVLPVELCANLKQVMESKPTFLGLPVRIRKRILSYALDTTRISSAIEKDVARRNNVTDLADLVHVNAVRRTRRELDPLYQVSSQISAEVTEVFRSQWLTIELNDPGRAHRLPDVLEFVGRTIVGKAQKLNLVVNHAGWAPWLQHLFTFLARRNGLVKLKQFKMHFRDLDKDNILRKQRDSVGLYPHRALHNDLSSLLLIRGVKATFTGDLPYCWWKPVATRMHCGTVGVWRLPRVNAQDINGALYQVDVIFPTSIEPAIYPHGGDSNNLA